MEYEGVKQTAQRLRVNVRTVQKWAKEGKIKGAEKVGRDWLIPAGTEAPSEDEKKKSYKHQFMPLLSADYTPGYCADFINAIEDFDDRSIASAEYFYYTANPQKAVEISERYVNSKDYALRLSASFVYVFANLSLGKIHLAGFGLDNINYCVQKVLADVNASKEVKAGAIFVGTAAKVLLHMPSDDIPPLDSVMYLLPQGLKLFSAYILAHKAYLKREYSLSLGMISIGLAVEEGHYPLASLYLRFIRCINLVSLKRTDEARSGFDEMCRSIDRGVYQPFAEHYGLLRGSMESRLKKQYPDDYVKIIEMVNVFSKSWRTLHNKLTNSTLTVHLNTTEFAIAMLFNRSWSVKEISAHMDISPRMVKHHLSVIYEKLGVSNREELGRFLLK